MKKILSLLALMLVVGMPTAEAMPARGHHPSASAGGKGGAKSKTSESTSKSVAAPAPAPAPVVSAVDPVLAPVVVAPAPASAVVEAVTAVPAPAPAAKPARRKRGGRNAVPAALAPAPKSPSSPGIAAAILNPINVFAVSTSLPSAPTVDEAFIAPHTVSIEPAPVPAVEAPERHDEEAVPAPAPAPVVVAEAPAPAVAVEAPAPAPAVETPAAAPAEAPASAVVEAVTEAPAPAVEASAETLDEEAAPAPAPAPVVVAEAPAPAPAVEAPAAAMAPVDDSDASVVSEVAGKTLHERTDEPVGDVSGEASGAAADVSDASLRDAQPAEIESVDVLGDSADPEVNVESLNETLSSDDRLKEAAVLMQKMMRGFLVRKPYKKQQETKKAEPKGAITLDGATLSYAELTNKIANITSSAGVRGVKTLEQLREIQAVLDTTTEQLNARLGVLGDDEAAAQEKETIRELFVTMQDVRGAIDPLIAELSVKPEEEAQEAAAEPRVPFKSVLPTQPSIPVEAHEQVLVTSTKAPEVTTPAPKSVEAAVLPPVKMQDEVSDKSMRARSKKFYRDAKKYATQHPIKTTAGVIVGGSSLFVLLDFIVHGGNTSRMWTSGLVAKTRKALNGLLR